MGPRRHALLLLAACTAGCGASSLSSLSGAEARRLGVAALAASRHPESPWTLVASAPDDRRCPGGTVVRRLRCHLLARSTRIRLLPTATGWCVVLVMPGLSDHVHRAHIRVTRDGAAIAVESEN